MENVKAKTGVREGKCELFTYEQQNFCIRGKRCKKGGWSLTQDESSFPLLFGNFFLWTQVTCFTCVTGSVGQFSSQSQRKAMPKNAQTIAQLHSSHTLVKLKIFQSRLQQYVNHELPDCLPHLLIKETQQHFRSLTVENLIITDLWVSHEELGGTHKSSPGCSVVKNPPANSGDSREVGLIPGSTKIPWSRKRQPTPVFSLENSMGWGVHGITVRPDWTHTRYNTCEKR